MDPLQKFDQDKEFRTSVLRIEGMIDSAIVQSAKDPNHIRIPAPEGMTIEIFEVLWKRYTEVGWTSFSWDKEKQILTILKRKES